MLIDHEVAVLATFPHDGSTLLLRTMQFMCGGECTATVSPHPHGNHTVHHYGRAKQYHTSLLLDDKLTALLPREQAWDRLGPKDSLLIKTHYPLVTGLSDADVVGTRLVRLIRNPVGHILARARHLGEFSVPGPHACCGPSPASTVDGGVWNSSKATRRRGHGRRHQQHRQRQVRRGCHGGGKGVGAVHEDVAQAKRCPEESRGARAGCPGRRRVRVWAARAARAPEVHGAKGARRQRVSVLWAAAIHPSSSHVVAFDSQRLWRSPTSPGVT